MATRKAGLPALYELMGSRGSRTSRAADVPDVPPPPVTHETDGSWLSPGRMLRLPVGYVLLGVALGLALVATAYIYGYRQAADVTEQEFSQTMIPSQTPLDPLDASGAGGSSDTTDSDGSFFRPPKAPVTAGGGTPSAAQATPAGPGWGEMFSDPRQTGLNYIILMQTDHSGAERVVQFCRDNGLETYAVGRNNARSYRVIVLPGFSAAERSSDQVRALEALIDQVGEKWMREKGGTTDFHDRYPSLYSG